MVQHSPHTRGHKPQERTKEYMELTTGSLLGKREERRRLGRHLSPGGFLIVLPKGYPRHLGFLLGLAQKLKEAGGDVKVHTL